MRWILSIILLCSFVFVSAQESLPGIQETRLITTIREDSSIKVQLIYDLILDDLKRMELKHLNFDDSPLYGVSASMEGQPMALDFVTINKLSVAEVEIPASPNTKVQLTLSYEIPVDWKNQFELIIPILYPDIKASNADQEFFQASLRVYEPYSIFEAFPSARWELQYESVFTQNTLTLQALPSMLKLKIGKGEKPIFGVLRLVDLGVIIVLLILLSLGWKKIKEV